MTMEGDLIRIRTDPTLHTPGTKPLGATETEEVVEEAAEAEEAVVEEAVEEEVTTETKPLKILTPLPGGEPPKNGKSTIS